MKNGLIAMVIAFGLASSDVVLAGQKYDQFYEATARVVSVEPIYRQVEVSVPVEECWREKVRVTSYRDYSRDSFVAPIAGAILGGVVGNQFGGGSGKDALTLGGALLGATIGDNVRKRHHRSMSPRYQQRCTTAYRYETRKELDGYHVLYRYDGEVSRIRMPYDPGHTIRVRVSVSPRD